MADTYQYRAQLTIKGGYPGEWRGTDPTDTGWHTANVGESYKAVTYSYYYTDSNNGDNNNSSRVIVSATDSWSAEYDSSNNLIVKVTTTINSIQRTQIRGNPLKGGNYTRDITVSRRSGATPVFTRNSDPIGYAHVLSRAISLGTETITISPGGNTPHSSLYVLNHTTGFPWDAKYTDEMWAGIHFKNTKENPSPEPPDIPKDYRPGATYNGSSWQSHNRNGGAASQYNGARWAEMRTQSGDSYENQPATGNPPSIRTNSNWRNMFNIGANRWPDGSPYEEN